MEQYFAREFVGPSFKLFTPPHLVFLGLILLGVLFLIYLRKRDNPSLNNTFRWTLAVFLILQETSYHAWNITVDTWTIKTMLPLHLCAAFIYLSAYMLITRNRYVYELTYLAGMSGAIQALLTPNIVGYNFPHYRFFQFFAAHGSIVIAALYMTIVERFRPTWRSFIKVFCWLNIYFVFVFIANKIIGSNYMFVMHKPENPSLLDFMGPWPVYILVGEVVALIMFLILYLPFAIHDWRKKDRYRMFGDILK